MIVRAEAARAESDVNMQLSLQIDGLPHHPLADAGDAEMLAADENRNYAFFVFLSNQPHTKSSKRNVFIFQETASGRQVPAFPHLVPHQIKILAGPAG